MSYLINWWRRWLGESVVEVDSRATIRYLKAIGWRAE